MRRTDNYEFSVKQNSSFPLNSPLALLKNFFLWESLRPTIKEISIVFYNSPLSLRNVDFVLILKILILQSFYKIADDQIEEEIKNRLSFLRFLDLQLGESVPGVNIIKLFREELADKMLLNYLFEQINNVLVKKNLLNADTDSNSTIVTASSPVNNGHHQTIVKKSLHNNKKTPTLKIQSRFGIHWMKRRVKRQQLIHYKKTRKQRLLPHFPALQNSHFQSDQDKKRSNNSTNTQLLNKGDNDLDVIEENIIICTKSTDSNQSASTKNNQLQDKSLLIINNYRRKKIRKRIEPFFGHQISAYRNKLIRMYWMTRARATINAKSVAYNLKRYLH